MSFVSDLGIVQYIGGIVISFTIITCFPWGGAIYTEQKQIMLLSRQAEYSICYRMQLCLAVNVYRSLILDSLHGLVIYCTLYTTVYMAWALNCTVHGLGLYIIYRIMDVYDVLYSMYNVQCTWSVSHAVHVLGPITYTCPSGPLSVMSFEKKWPDILLYLGRHEYM